MVYHPQASLSPVVACAEIAFPDLGQIWSEKIRYRTMEQWHIIHSFKVRLGSVRFGSIRPIGGLYSMLSSLLKKSNIKW